MPRCVILLFLVFGTSVCFAWNEPSGFRAFPWGTSCAKIRDTVAPEIEKWNNNYADFLKKLWGVNKPKPDKDSYKKAAEAFRRGVRVISCDTVLSGCSVNRDWLGDDILIRTEYTCGTHGLEQVELRFESKDFSSVAEAFIAKYGEPTQRTAPQIQNGLGAIFSNETYLWQGEITTVSLQRYREDVNHGYARLATNDRLRRDSAKEKARVQERAKGL